jgi:hypothetical protein
MLTALDFSETKNIRTRLLEIDRSISIGDEFAVKKADEGLRGHGKNKRTHYQIKYAVFNTLRNVVLSKETKDAMVFEKVSNTRSYIKTLSVGIVTQNTNDSNIKNNITVASKHCDRIIICSEADDGNIKSCPKVKSLIFIDDCIDVRVKISTKKKLILEENNSEFILLIHDHVMLTDSFFCNFFKSDCLFDLYSCNRYSAEDYPNEVSAHGDIFKYRGGVESISNYYKNANYDSLDSFYELVANGAFLLLRSSFLSRFTWPEHLQWGDMEDIHLSRQIYLEGGVFYFDNSNKFYASSRRMGRSRYRFLSLIKINLLRIITYVSQKFIYKDYD